MINMSITAAGLALRPQESDLTFTRFVAGSGIDPASQAIQEACQTIPIAHSQIYRAGETYLLNGLETVFSENKLKLVGLLEASKATSSYTWRELALMVRVGEAPEEITYAYGSMPQSNYPVQAGAQDTFVINFEQIYETIPQITVETTQTGVTWVDFLSHTNANLSGSGAHGLSYADDDLVVNGIPLGLTKSSDIRAMCGVEAILSTLPQPNVAWLEKMVLLRSEGQLYRLQLARAIKVGQFIYPVGEGWEIGSGVEEGALLIVADTATPAPNEIPLSQAQSYFLEWTPCPNLEERVRTLEEDTDALRVSHLDTNDYNNQWLPEPMAGSGTEQSPYLVRTPYDFEQIRFNPSASYRLINNLDFTGCIGIPVRQEGGTIVYGELNEKAPLYNEGKGWIPIEEFSGTLDGNGKIIKGLTSCSDSACGLVNTITNAKIIGLTLKEGYLINTNAQESEVYIGAFFGHAGGSLYLENCINYNTVVNTRTTSTHMVYLGGIAGNCDNVDKRTYTFKNCANHGQLIAYNQKNTLSGLGYIYTFVGVTVTIDGFYNTSSLQGTEVYGLSLFSSSSSKSSLSHCYNVGRLQGAQKSVALTQYYDSGGDSHCYALAENGDLMNGIVGLSAEEMQAPEFCDLLNAGLETGIFVPDTTQANAGYPLFSFEANRAESIPGQLPLALVDPIESKVYSTKFTYNQLFSLASKEKLRLAELRLQESQTQLEERLQKAEGNLTSAKATIPQLKLQTLTPANWTQAEDVWQQTVRISGLKTSSQVLAIPQSAEHFTYALQLTPTSNQLTFTATSQPTQDLTVGLLIVA